MGITKWNGKRGVEWKWKGVSVIELSERKNGMGMDAYEWIENIDAIRNENKG